jgi:hypothetical protein
LIREYGGGVLSTAEQTLLRVDGMTLDEKLEEKRQKQLVLNFLRQKFSHKAKVSQQDIALLSGYKSNSNNWLWNPWS